MQLQQTEKSVQESIFDEMMKAGVHYGRAKRYTHPLMKPFLLKTNKNIEIFDLRYTLQKLNETADFLKKALEENKTILFVGVVPAAQNKIKEIAEKFNQPYLNYKWVGGFLTNFQTIQARFLYFKDLLKKEESGELQNYLPKERSRIERELNKLKFIYGGCYEMTKLPDYVFIVNLAFNQHQTAKREAIKMKIPIISISGSDNDISKVHLFIPANDKAPRSIAFLIDYLIEKIQASSNNINKSKIENTTENNG